MTIREYNKAIILLIHLIVMNNAFKVANALKEVGYDTKNFIPAPELEAALLQLYMADPNKFFQVMNNVTWNYGHVATNVPEGRDQVINLISQAGIETDKSNWWQNFIGLITKQYSLIN